MTLVALGWTVACLFLGDAQLIQFHCSIIDIPLFGLAIVAHYPHAGVGKKLRIQTHVSHLFVSYKCVLAFIRVVELWIRSNQLWILFSIAADSTEANTVFWDFSMFL